MDVRRLLGAVVLRAPLEVRVRKDPDLLEQGQGPVDRRRVHPRHLPLHAANERLRKLEAGSRPEEIEAARARVAAAEARVSQLEQQMEDASILSPVEGVVTEKLAERGELVGAGGGIALVTDLAGAWLNVYVGEPNLGAIRIGQEVEVQV